MYSDLSSPLLNQADIMIINCIIKTWTVWSEKSYAWWIDMDISTNTSWLVKNLNHTSFNTTKTAKPPPARSSDEQAELLLSQCLPISPNVSWGPLTSPRVFKCLMGSPKRHSIPSCLKGSPHVSQGFPVSSRFSKGLQISHNVSRWTGWGTSVPTSLNISQDPPQSSRDILLLIQFRST